MGHVYKIRDRMIFVTGANFAIIMAEVALNFWKIVICPPTWLTLQTVTGLKIQVQRKVRLNMTFGNTTYYHVVHLDKIRDPSGVGQVFLKENNLLDFKNNELHLRAEGGDLFKTKNPEIKYVHQGITWTELIINMERLVL